MITSSRAAVVAMVAGLILGAMPSHAAPLRSGFAADVSQRRDFRDLGRAPAMMPVSIAVTLNYQHEAELRQLIQLQGDRRSPFYHHYLSNYQFNNYFAPSPAAYAHVVDTLRRSGFTITRTYANRTIVDAIAPSAVAERLFQTQIHTVVQDRHGIRYANARPALMPLALRGVVSAVSGLNNLIVARPLISYAHPWAALNTAPIGASGSATGRTQVPSPRVRVPRTTTSAVRPLAGNVVLDPGFESGGFSAGWLHCGNVTSMTTISTYRKHSGIYSERSGSTNTGTAEPNGDTGACQSVTIPAGGTLSFWVYELSGEFDATFAWQEADLLNSSGQRVVQFYKTVANTNGWVQKTFNVSAYAGQTLRLYFGVHGDGYPFIGTIQYVDDVSLTGSGTPPPTPTPTPPPPTPTPTPTPHPTPTPTPPPPTPTPTPHPTPTPTPPPTPTPTPTPTPPPTPTPTPVSGCPGSTAVGGALHGPDTGFGPVAEANGYDLPVQHGCNGTGHSSGVAISGDYLDSDLASFLSQFGITRTGPATTRVQVDGGATFGNTADSQEATLDVQTIVSLAPGTHLYMYLFPDLSSQHIEDGYNQAVTDGVVDVLNSSFGGCETGDTAFATTTDQIAQQGAAKGITFFASSGDNGSSQNGCVGNAVSAPASGPNFVAVGGTSLFVNTNGSYSSESAWSGSGGGVSTVFAEPSYQVGVAGASSSGRNVPDVSAAADPNTGFSWFFNGAWSGPIGGTSWSSPMWSALQTEVNQRQGARNGFVNARIYSAFGAHGYTLFHDITSGSNGGFSAHAGYDNVTGIGSPQGFAFSGAE